ELLGDRTGSHASRGLARARTSATGDRADAVLRVVGIVRVARPIGALDVVVVLAASVGIADQHRDRRAERDAVEHARQDLDLIGLLALTDESALAGLSAIERGLDRRDVERQLRWT